MNDVITFKKRRAVSQVIGTMMILAVTVAGAVFLSNLMSNEFFAVDQNPVAEARIDSIRLTSYDTRDSVKLTDVPDLINNVGHTWDEFAVGDLVLTNNIGSGGNYPRAGTFSIIPVENDAPIKQLATNEIPGDGEVRLVIKLSGNIPQNIGMWSSLRVLVNFGGSQPAEFIILSGDAKW